MRKVILLSIIKLKIFFFNLELVLVFAFKKHCKVLDWLESRIDYKKNTLKNRK